MSANSIIARMRDRFLYDIIRYVPRSRPFVFGIGLSKTGTTSLNDALEHLGYNTFHLPPIAAAPNGVVQSTWPWWVYKYNALTDMTVAVLHRELRQVFPNARFIYTRRHMEPWLKSCSQHFTAALARQRIENGQLYIGPLLETVYGSQTFCAESYRQAYLKHDADVLATHGGADNFLTFDLTAGAGWEPLCSFLGTPIPDAPFPQSNRRAAQPRLPALEPEPVTA